MRLTPAAEKVWAQTSRAFRPGSLAVLAGATCLLVTALHEPRAASASIPADAPQGPVIVRIVGRAATITARAGRDGPVYSVQDNAGHTIARPMTLPQLHAQHPDEAQQLKSMSADGAWAGIDTD